MSILITRNFIRLVLVGVIVFGLMLQAERSVVVNGQDFRQCNNVCGPICERLCGTRFFFHCCSGQSYSKKIVFNLEFNC